MFPTPVAQLCSCQRCARPPTLHVGVFFLVMLVNVQCCLVVLTCILLPDDVEHRFMCLLCV